MTDARLKRETDFHNQRFADGDDRTDQLKYYWSITNGWNEYWNRVCSLSSDARVLEYGCSEGSNAAKLAELSSWYEGIDISDIAITNATQRFGSETVKFHVMDAMNMTFEDAQFDLVFGSGIIHHLDTEQSMKDIFRVLKPGGTAIFWEPLGMNPLIEAYRYATPSVRTPDEHPLLPRDFRIMRNFFPYVAVKHYGLTTLASVPFRNQGFGSSLKIFLEKLDSAFFLIPGVKYFSWYCLAELKKSP
jgi:SAM-dependent methyltransferase